MSRLASEYHLRLDTEADALSVIASGVRRCVFTLDDVAADFFNLKSRLAGNVFQKLVREQNVSAFQGGIGYL